MQALFTLLRVVFGMRDAMWEGKLEQESTTGSQDVYAQDGPLNPPKP